MLFVLPDKSSHFSQRLSLLILPNASETRQLSKRCPKVQSENNRMLWSRDKIAAHFDTTQVTTDFTAQNT